MSLSWPDCENNTGELATLHWMPEMVEQTPNLALISLIVSISPLPVSGWSALSHGDQSQLIWILGFGVGGGTGVAVTVSVENNNIFKVNLTSILTFLLLTFNS